MYKTFYKIRKYLYKSRNSLNLFIVTGGLLITLIMSIAFYYTGYKKVKDEFVTNKDNMAQVQKSINEIESIRKSDKVFQDKANKMRQIRDSLNDILPGKKNVPFIISQISMAANQSGVYLSTVDKTGEALVTFEKSNLKVLTYDLTCLGNYSAFVKFMAYLESNKNIFSVEYIKLTQPEKMFDANDVNVQLQLNFYLKPEA